jgi:hypothetical protein
VQGAFIKWVLVLPRLEGGAPLLRVTASGTRSFVFSYYFQGTERRAIVGQLVPWTVPQAR